MSRIQVLAARFQRFFMLVFWAVPLVHLVIWLTLGPTDQDADWSLHLTGLDMVEIVGPVGWPARVLGFAASMLAGGLDMAVMLYLSRLFGEFAGGEVFTARAAALLRRAGLFLVLAQAAEPVSAALCSLAATMGNPPGRHMVAVSLSDVDVFTVVLGLALFFAARLMDEARELREADALTI
ncbi:DUF2975 domain-containing protein [Desulfocurvus sp. DL9XJH121]